jgi:rhodanese-related sulfurtransferase
LLDTRDGAKFEGAHLKGSVNVGLGGSYATWCGTLLDPERPIVLIAEPGREVEAATRLGRIAFDTIAGYLAGGMEALAGEPDLIDRIERITAGSLTEQLVAQAPPLLIDVRAPGEWEQERIDSAVNVPLSRFPERLETLPRDREIVVYCASGYRSAIAAGLLRRDGFPHVADLVGGMAAWASPPQVEPADP